ncbi:act minimal PKS chain-length factor (CLF/KS beta) [Micromonospora violae]|uniref:Act minimal PKS chain-length factor (CLF/KS beta) n=1 Tax=Micromonospora violae TaxID=1278207 RepID=A0A4Q7UN28_9ACTN|nr:ketosynthase chain-length factor [Micromonospora violae]RZT82414.1 act minimal PKS chain-length factor (CLF/KS beta) [Micromonospora violae]
MTTVVTGVGVAAPNGLGRDAFWAATVAGVGGIGPISRFDPSDYPAQLAGEVPGYAAAEHIPSRLMAQTDHMTRLALTAAQWALADASVDPSALPEFGMGVVTASASGGFEFGHRELEKLWSKGSEHVSAYQSFAWFYAVNTGQISIRHGMRGPTGVLVTEQAGGLDAVAQARRQVRKGVQLVMTGGVDASLCPWGWTAQLANGLLSTGRDPATAFLPFDANASGYVPGEGGAILVLEDERAAARRGAAVYGVIAGYGATFDPRPGSGRPPGLRRAAEMALSDAGLTPADIDVVFADGAGVAELDRVEAEAITAVFGARGVPVTAPKTMTGRLYSGGAALDLVSALLSIRHGVIPPTTNIRQPAEGLQLDLVRDVARETPVRAALVLARGYGGFNAAMVVTDERNGR